MVTPSATASAPVPPPLPSARIYTNLIKALPRCEVDHRGPLGTGRRSPKEAPDRLVRFLSNPVYRALTIPTRSLARVTNAASSAFLWTVKRLAGPQIVQDTVEFFRSISSLEAGLRQRAAEMAESGLDTRFE